MTKKKIIMYGVGFFLAILCGSWLYFNFLDKKKKTSALGDGSNNSSGTSDTTSTDSNDSSNNDTNDNSGSSGSGGSLDHITNSAPGYLNLEQFPDITVPTNYHICFSDNITKMAKWGNYPLPAKKGWNRMGAKSDEYSISVPSEVRGHLLGDAPTVSDALKNAASEVGAHIRTAVNLIPNLSGIAGLSDSDIIALGRNYYQWEKWNSSIAEPNPAAPARRNGFIILDFETNFGSSNEGMRFMTLIGKGMIDQSIINGDNPEFKLIHYYYPVPKFTHYADPESPSAHLTMYPFYTEQKIASTVQDNYFSLKIKENTNGLRAGVNKKQIVPISEYFKVPIPLTSTMYQKDANGNYIIDTTTGFRKFRTGDFSESIRGVNITWHQNPVGGAMPMPNGVNEVYYSVFQKLWAIDNLYLNHVHFKKAAGISTGWLSRLECETTAFAQDYNTPRPNSEFERQIYVSSALVGSDAYISWEGRAANTTEPIFINGRVFESLSAIEDDTKAIQIIFSKKPNTHPIWNLGDVFMAKKFASLTQSSILGRYYEKTVIISAFDPRLDVGEAPILVSMKNTATNEVKGFTINPKKVTNEVFEFTSNVNPANLEFSYKNVLGNTETVKGDVNDVLYF